MLSPAVNSTQSPADSVVGHPTPQALYDTLRQRDLVQKVELRAMSEASGLQPPAMGGGSTGGWSELWMGELRADGYFWLIKIKTRPTADVKIGQ